MTGYYAQWNNTPFEADKLDMYVRPVQFNDRPIPCSERVQPAEDLSSGDTPFDAVGQGIAASDSAPLSPAPNPVATRDENAELVRAESETESSRRGVLSLMDEPSFDWPSTAQSVASSDDAPIEPSLKTFSELSSEDDLEPVLRASAEWLPTSPPEPALQTLPETPAAAPLSNPSDFSDLIGLAGLSVLDDRYQDGPTGERELLPAFGRLSTGGGLQLPAETDESDPLATLTSEYRQALLQHKRGYTHDLKNVAADKTSIATPPQDPFQDTSERYAEGSLMDDLLGSDRNIDALLESLDTFGAEQIFEADPQHEILALLAPGSVPDLLFPQTALLARQEHHLITVDSHFSMLESTQHDELDSQNENHR